MGKDTIGEKKTVRIIRFPDLDISCNHLPLAIGNPSAQTGTGLLA